MSPELLAVFNRICDEVTAAHGGPHLRMTEASDRFTQGRDMIAAGWGIGPDLANHGFKVWEGPDGIELLTWAHVGDFASARVFLRTVTLAEQTLRRILPPGLAIAQEAADA